MKKLFIFILFLTLSTPCWGRDLNDPSILKFYARLNSNSKDLISGVSGVWSGDESYITLPWGQTAADFDGTDDQINFGDLAAFDVNGGDFSLTFFYNADPGSQYLGIVNKINNARTDGFMVRVDASGDLRFQTSDGVDSVLSDSTAATFVDGKWHFVSAVFKSNNTQYLYIDTKLQASNSVSSISDVDTTENFFVSNQNGARLFGSVAEVRFYNVALTQDEIQTLYELNLPDYNQPQQPIDVLPDVSDSSLKGAWLNKAVVGAKDLSSNNNNGTATKVSWNEVGGEFDGVSGSVAVPADSSINFNGKTETTITFWINPQSDGENNGGRVFIKGSNICSVSANNGSGVSLGCAVDVSGTDSVVSVTPASSILLNTNTFVAFTWNDDGTGTGRLYINGELNNSGASQSTIPNNDSAQILYIGNQSSDDRTFDGDIKDFRIYSEAKSADWIAEEYAKSVPDDGLILHIQNGDKDLSRYNNTLIASGVVLGNGVEFNSSDNSITFTDSIDVIGNSNFTIVAITNVDAVGQNYSILNIKDADNDGFSFFFQGSNNWWVQYDALDTKTSDSYIANKTYHLVCVIDASDKIRIYINGEESSYSAQPSIASEDMAIATSTAYIGLQGYDNTQDFDGHIYDFRIYDSAWSADEAKQDYERTKKFY